MDAQRFSLDVPVDHDAAAAIAHVPLRCQVLIPRTEMFGIGRASRRSFAPDRRITGTQRTIIDPQVDMTLSGNGSSEASKKLRSRSRSPLAAVRCSVAISAAWAASRGAKLHSTPYLMWFHTCSTGFSSAAYGGNPSTVNRGESRNN